MTYITHKRFAVWLGMIGAMLAYLVDINEINYYLNLILFIQFSKVGGLFPDIDHHWASVKEKTSINWIINKLIRITGGKHRSWQTHSIDIAILITIISFILPSKLLERGIINAVDKEIIAAILFGFMVGWISHLWSDMLTSAGVRLFCFMKFKVALVPNKLFGLRFKTGEDWEMFVSKFTQCVNIVVGIIAVGFPYIIKYI